MKALTLGCESEEKIDLIISFTGIRSEPMIKSLKQHLVDGVPEKYASKFNGVLQQNFDRDLEKLNKEARKVNRINELDGHVRKQIRWKNFLKRGGKVLVGSV